MLTRLMNELEALRSAWQGRGGRAFEQTKQAWAEDQRKLQQALVLTAEAIKKSGSGYTSTDDTAASQMSAVHRGTTLPL